MDATAHLKNAIEFAGRGPSAGDEPFVEEALCQAIDRALENDPALIEIAGSGEKARSRQNVLVALSQVSPRAALYWAQKRGPEAWSSTVFNRSPFLSVIDPKGRFRRKSDYRFAEQAAYCPHQLRGEFADLVILGLRHAMPLRENDLDEPAFADIAKETSISDQAALTQYLLGVKRGPTEEAGWASVWATFQEESGALIFEDKLFAPFIAEKDAFDPARTVWHRKNKVYQQAPWSECWRQAQDWMYISVEAGEVVPWLEKRGVVMEREFHKFFVAKMCERVRKNESSWRAWEDLYQELSSRPNGWNEEVEGSLLWQILLKGKPKMIDAALAKPPPTGFAQKGSGGSGLWDELDPQRNISMSTNQMKRLDAVLKVDTEIKIASWTEAGLRFAHASIKGNPSGWIGEPSAKQNRFAAMLLSAVCSPWTEHSLPALKTQRLLANYPSVVSAMGPPLRAALWVIGEMRAADCFSRLMGEDEPAPQVPMEPSSKWCAPFLTALRRSLNNEDIDPGRADIARALIESAALRNEAPLGSWPPQRPARRI